MHVASDWIGDDVVENLITVLPFADDAELPLNQETGAHPMRKVTRQVAFDRAGWSKERAAKVTELFDQMAPEWAEKDFEARNKPVLDALGRGDIGFGGIGIELGCGTGPYSALLSSLFETLLCIDLSFEMLVRSSSDKGTRIRGDGAMLPVADRSVHGLICINVLLFPAEVERVLADDGYLLWVSSGGEQTPIYLSPREVVEAMGGNFTCVTSRAGAGIWSVLRRRG